MAPSATSRLPAATSGTASADPVRGSAVPARREADPGETEPDGPSTGGVEVAVAGTVELAMVVVLGSIVGLVAVVVSGTGAVEDVDDEGTPEVQGTSGESPQPWSW